MDFDFSTVDLGAIVLGDDMREHITSRMSGDDAGTVYSVVRNGVWCGYVLVTTNDNVLPQPSTLTIIPFSFSLETTVLVADVVDELCETFGTMYRKHIVSLYAPAMSHMKTMVRLLESRGFVAVQNYPSLDWGNGTIQLVRDQARPTFSVIIESVIDAVRLVRTILQWRDPL